MVLPWWFCMCALFLRGKELSFPLKDNKKILSSSISFSRGRAFRPVLKKNFPMLQNHHIFENRIVLVTTNTKNRMPVFHYPPFALEAIQTLYRTQELFPFFLYAFVFMPDHCHLLMRVPGKAGLATVMRIFKGGASHNIGLGPLWQSKFDAKTFDDPSIALHYIHQNPVKAGLVQAAELYPWSSASGRWDVSDLDI